MHSLTRIRRHLILRLREEGGWNLTELLIASVLMIVILSATLTALSTFEQGKRRNEEQNDAQQEARRATTVLVRSLRNLASPTQQTLRPVEVAEDFDMVFITVDPRGPDAGTGDNTNNLRRERFCYDGATDRVVYQSHTWNTAAPTPADPTAGMHASCPSADATWDPIGGPGTRFRTLAQQLVNDRSGVDERDMFVYQLVDPVPPPDDPSTPAVDESILPDCTPRPVPPSCLKYISSVHTNLFTDVNAVDRNPRESNLESGVIIRNQNGPPVPVGSAVGDGTLFTLNGTLSFDPESEPLTYTWRIEIDPASGPPITIVRTGAIVPITPGSGGDFPTLVSLCGAGVDTTTITLTVTDSGGLSENVNVTPPCT